jgi:hypothetical protein
MSTTFDIHIQVLPEAEQKDTFKFMSFGFAESIGVKGFQMLINQWLLCFLTRRGSDPADLARGTVFTSLIGSNLALADARDVVSLSVDQCNEQVSAFQRNDFTLTASERLASASVVGFTEQPSAPGFDVVVEIRNQAGQRLVFNLPNYATS